MGSRRFRLAWAKPGWAPAVINGGVADREGTKARQKRVVGVVVSSDVHEASLPRLRNEIDQAAQNPPGAPFLAKGKVLPAFFYDARAFKPL